MVEAHGFDAVINLAIINNDQHASPEELKEVNVELPLKLATSCARIGIRTFIQPSSTHTLDTDNQSNYARSKREADAHLRQVTDVNVITLILPMVWGDQWSGALSPLNSLPTTVALALFRPLAALKPTVHIDHLASTLLNNLESPTHSRILSDDVDGNGYYRAISALIDYGFAICVLALFWWALLIIALSIKATSPGPGIFAQTRVGKHGQSFTCYKFRTMQTGTPQAGTHEVSSAQVTAIGAFLRRTKLDELPQCWNILKGEIRLVGPRPGLPVQTELFEARNAKDVFRVTPGITGWAQIHDIDMSDPWLLAEWDSEYISLRSLILDLKIIVSTGLGRGRGDRLIERQPPS